jgi:protein SCO1/2
MRRRSVVAAFCVLGVLAVAPTFSRAEVRFQQLSKPKPVAAFALRDQDGQPFTAERLQGHWSLLFMGYTSCPDICPYTLANLAAVLAALSTHTPSAPLPKVVFLAVDPARDQPLLKDYLDNFDPGFIGITGSPDAIQILIDGVDGYVHRDAPDKDGNYAVAHTAAVSVIDPEGRIVARLLPPFQPVDTADRLAALFQEQAPR